MRVMPQQNASTAATRQDALPIAGRTMELRGFQRAADPGEQGAALATAEIVFTTGGRVRRYDWYRERNYIEELVVEDGAIRLDRLSRGAPLLNSHNSWDLEDQLGVTTNPAISAGQGTCGVTFSRRESIAGYVQDVADGIIRNVSVGYVRHKIEMVPPEDGQGDTWTYRVIDWEPYEVSLVPIPADMDCQVVRSAGQIDTAPDGQPQRQLRTFACQFTEVSPRARTAAPAVDATTRAAAHTTQEQSMTQPVTEANGGAPATPATTASQDAQQRQSDASTQAAAQAAQRAADITELCARHGVSHLAAGMIRAGQSLEQAQSAVLAELAHRDAASGGHRNVAPRIETVRDEMATRMSGMEVAIASRLDARVQLDDNSRQYRGMSLLEIGRDLLESHGVNTRGMDRLTLAQRMLHFRSGAHTTSDFSSLFANVANKRLRGAYEENPGTYALWARRAPNAPDFKSISVAQLSGAPSLLQTNEAGEFKYGKMVDGAETYSVVTYGRIVALTRQAIVNDDLRAFDRLTTAFGFAARRLENATVYAELTNNAALADGTALFHADHANLGTGAGSALSATSLATARTAMRKQTGLNSEPLNIAPAYLIVPAALEQTAYQLTSANYVPATKAEINEFRAGGRSALEPIVEPLLDGTSAAYWYLASNSMQVDTVEYCYLDGAEGPVIESEVGFEVDGISYKCRLDFAAKAVDHRGLYRANGA